MIVLKILAWAVLALLICALLIVLYAAITASYKMHRYPLRQIYEKRKMQDDYCPLNKVKGRFVELLLYKEDDTFYRHRGLFLKGIKEAIKRNLKERRIVSSGSTITQQLIKNLYFRFHKNIFRKLTEIFMALKAEKILSKDEILELYINTIYYGCGTYGISDAAEYYFGVKPEDMSFNQMFMIMVFLNAPTARNPLLHPDAYRDFNKELTERWAKRGVITKDEVDIINRNLENGFDPQLRKSADGERKYGKDILINEKFGVEANASCQP